MSPPAAGHNHNPDPWTNVVGRCCCVHCGHHHMVHASLTSTAPDRAIACRCTSNSTNSLHSHIRMEAGSNQHKAESGLSLDSCLGAGSPEAASMGVPLLQYGLTNRNKDRSITSATSEQANPWSSGVPLQHHGDNAPPALQPSCTHPRSCHVST